LKRRKRQCFSARAKDSPSGILNDARITNVVELTEAEFSDWKQWRKKLFAKVPLSLRRKGEFVFPVGTVESNLMTMADDVGRPIFKDAAGVDFTDDSIDGKFFCREVNLVEPDVIVNFDEASAGDVVGVYFQPKDYAFNTQLTFGIKRYFDEETNQWVNKGITVTDGKMLDVKNCWIIKKK
jgi:HK97 family phage major capsid protein